MPLIPSDRVECDCECSSPLRSPLTPGPLSPLSPTEIVIQPPLELIDSDCCCPQLIGSSSKPNSRRGSHTSTASGTCCPTLEVAEVYHNQRKEGGVAFPEGGGAFLEVFAPEHLLHPNNNTTNTATGDSAVSLQLGEVKRRSYEQNMNANSTTNGGGGGNNANVNRHSELVVPSSGGGGGHSTGTHGRGNHPHRMSYTGTSINEKKAAAAAAAEREQRPISSTMGRPASTRAGGVPRRVGKVREKETQ